jgi:hypothetical protein
MDDSKDKIGPRRMKKATAAMGNKEMGSYKTSSFHNLPSTSQLTKNATLL